MPDSQCSTPPTMLVDDKNLKRSFQQYCIMDKPSLAEAQKRKRANRIHLVNQQHSQYPHQPRWHNQAYMLFLALRQHSEKTMARTDLIKSALAIDTRISEERLVPKVFKGKTPMNSASAILTNNSDRYFIPFKPDGSKSMHFRLSFEPGSFESALKEYNEWQENLIANDWPNCFGGGVSNGNSKIMTENMVKELEVKQQRVLITYPTEFDEFIANRKRARLLLEQQQKQHRQQEQSEQPEQPEQQQQNGKENITLAAAASTKIQLPPPTTPQLWQEIISIRNEKGVFANRNLPKNIPIGFYFGVPLSEEEFESMKDGIGKALNYSFMYKKTIIDPTDKNGELYNQIICPFHYIRETTAKDEANVVFYEGEIVNQIICWTKKDILPGEELLSYCPNINSNEVVAPVKTATITTDVATTAATNNMTAPPTAFIVQPPLPQQYPNYQQQQPSIIAPAPAPVSTSTTNGNSSNTNSEYWQKKPSISSMLNTTIPI